MNPSAATRSATRLTVIYLVFGVIWISFSDQWVAWVVDDAAQMARLQTLKGWVFVLVTGAMFFWLARQALRQQYQLLHRDKLTGLYNREVLQTELRNQLKLADTEHEMVAVFTLNLDGFKQINATQGVSSGDTVLVAVANGLQRRYETRAVIGRIGADEFVLALRGRFPQDELNKTAMDLAALCQQVNIPGDSGTLTCCVGVSVYPQDGKHAAQLLSASGVAVEQAKTEGSGTFRVFNQTFRASFESQLNLIRDLRLAVNERRFELVYQPQYRIADGSLTGVEVLLRWLHPERGWVSPAEFIPLAERQGLIQAITRQVFEQAFQELHDAGLLGQGLQRVSVNISALDLDDEAHVAALIDTLKPFGAAARYLQLEVTETALMRNVDKARDAMSRLRAIGVRFSIDDFGTGYSSLNMLKRLPIDELKIDQTFICDVPDGENDSVIVKTIIAMAHSLGFTLIAEGVETEAQRQFLASNGCEEMQGFLLARPMAIRELAALLSADIPV